MISLLLTAGALALVTFVVLAISLWHRQERIVFQPPSGPWPEVRHSRLSYSATDGQPLFAYVVTPRDTSGSAPPPVLISFHGNAEIAAWSIPWADEVALRTGYTVLLPEYRGYAGLGGSPTYPGSALDAQAAWDAARRELGAVPDRTVLYGHSLGSAVAVELAQQMTPSALLLEAPLSSARAMASRLGLPGIGALFGIISRVHFDTRARVAELPVPVWVVHGSRDIVIPVRMGREVHAAAREKGELLVIEGAGHNDVVERGGDRYWEWLTRALRR